jgi:dolichyl-phosphate beta-glucosyltransferase
VMPWLEAQNASYEVIVNDDGSVDDTAAIVRDFAARYPGRVRLLRGTVNRGKGAGLRRAVLATRGRVVLCSDADFPTPVEELTRLRTALAAGADMAIGARPQPDGSDMRASQPLYRRLFDRPFHRLADQMIVRGIGDSQSGFKAFKGDVARELFQASMLDSIVYDVEVLYLAQRRGYLVAEVPVRWTDNGARGCGSASVTPDAFCTTCCASLGCTATTPRPDRRGSVASCPTAQPRCVLHDR